MSALTFPAAAFGLRAGYGDHVTLRTGTALQLSSKFVNLVTPAGLGSTALTVGLPAARRHRRHLGADDRRRDGPRERRRRGRPGPRLRVGRRPPPRRRRAPSPAPGRIALIAVLVTRRRRRHRRPHPAGPLGRRAPPPPHVGDHPPARPLAPRDPHDRRVVAGDRDPVRACASPPVCGPSAATSRSPPSSSSTGRRRRSATSPRSPVASASPRPASSPVSPLSGVPTDVAVAAALTHRVATFWLPPDRRVVRAAPPAPPPPRLTLHPLPTGAPHDRTPHLRHRHRRPLHRGVRRPNDPTVLLIMGAGSSMVRWDDRFCRRLVAGGRHVVRYDHRDVGRSTTDEPGQAAYTLEHLADDAVAVLDSLAVERAHLVGASMGGMIAQLVALRHPARVRTITAIMSTPDPSATMSFLTGGHATASSRRRPSPCSNASPPASRSTGATTRRSSTTSSRCSGPSPAAAAPLRRRHESGRSPRSS